MAKILMTKKDTQQVLILEYGCDEAIPSHSESKLNENTVALGDNITVSRSRNEIWSKPHPWNSGGIQPFTGGLSILSI
jgi:phosphoribosyl-AMP cyclohydrolase